MSRRLRIATATVFQVGLVLAATAWGVHETREWREDRELPALRSEPLVIEPLYDDPAMLSDIELRSTLSRLTLPERGTETSIGHVDHGLRFWGVEADPGDPAMMSGEDMRRLLTNHWRFVRTYGVGSEPLLMAAEEGDGVRVRIFSGAASSPHVDHTLATLAEVGTPRDFEIFGPRGQTTLRALLEQSLRDFAPDQPEYEWSALTYALFLPPAREWTTSEGQRISFDLLADRILREELPNGVCSGNHRLYTLVVFLRADDQMATAGEPRILSPESRERIERFLADATATLVRNQHPEGFWNGTWPYAAPASSQPTGGDDRLSDRLIVTGHALEWWALAPPELLPPPAVRRSASRWLVRTIAAMDPDEIDTSFSFLSHAGRALALWRGREPAEVDLLPPVVRPADA